MLPRTIELDGIAPSTGTRLALAETGGRFVVTKVARSPLPRDARLCAYLQRID